MKKLLLIIFALLGNQLVFAQQSQSLSDLRSAIDSLFSATQGDFAVAFTDLSNGEQLLINDKVEYHAASTMKTPVMIEIFRQVEEGRFRLQDSILIKNEFRSIVSGKPFHLDLSRDSGDSLYEKIGSHARVEDLMVDMIIHSSNLATNLLIEMVDARKITETLRRLGAEDMTVLRGVEDIEAYDAGLSNTTTAYDLMLIFQKLAKGEAVGKLTDARMIEILLQQQHKELIPALLPMEVKVAHKTGSITGLRHDSGIVILPDGRRYVLVLLSKNMEEPDKGIRMLAQVSKMIYEYVKF